MISRPHNITFLSATRAVAGYAFLPGIWSRLTGLIPDFGMIAYLMALVFENIRLLPHGHPMLRPDRIGTYRIRDVLAAAAQNLKGGWKNSDQYIIFGMFVLGTVTLIVQFVLLGSLIFISTAQAAGVPNFINMFITTYPQIDLAHLMMDRVFGIPEFFYSCFDPTVNAADPTTCEGFVTSTVFPTPTQSALQALFRFYSMGMLAVAGLLIVYYIFAMLAETVNTGRPFGSRFQSIYTPVRLVIAILLLLPLAYGYNTGQYIVFWAAKWGSAFATNAWWLYNNRAGDNPLGLEPQEMIGSPKIQDIETIINFFYLANTCHAAYSLAYDKEIRPYFVKSSGFGGASAAQAVGIGTTFDEARAFFDQGDVKIVFGHQNDEYTKYTGQVKPYCGAITIPSHSKEVTGITDIYNVYFSAIMNMWYNADMSAYGTRMACNLRFSGKDGCLPLPATNIAWDAPDTSVAGQNFYADTRLDRQADFTAQMQAQLDTLRTTDNRELIMDQRTMMLGWGGAGVWFNKIMSFNGALVDAMMNLPAPSKYPMIMEHVAEKKKAFEKKTEPREKYSLTTSSGGKTITLDKQLDDADLDDPSQDAEIANLLDAVYKQLQDSEATAKPRTGNTDNPVKNFVSIIFGQSGIFDFRANGEVFPLAKLAMLGREIIDKTVIMLVSGGLISGFSGLAGADAGPLGDAIGNIGATMMSFATMGIATGVMLYYVIPLLPFLYVFFAVGRWVKSVFEAMVAIPLWAMAHLRLGGEGLPGPGASQGYLLILEIFLRPIMVLFGLMMAIACFMAMTSAMDSVFNLAVANVGGFDMVSISSGGPDTLLNSARDGLDALFYTILYAMLVYAIATSSFKLIDIVPSSIMRWIGSSVSGFNDQTDIEGELDYNLVYQVDAMARDITKAGSNFDDFARAQAKNMGKYS